jgi:hypothetical protein
MTKTIAPATPAGAAVIQFAAFAEAAKARKANTRAGPLASYLKERKAADAAKVAEAIEAPERLTTTCLNQRLRLGRREKWWAARRLTHFRQALMEWVSALQCAQRNDVQGANLYPSAEDEWHRCDFVSQWRAALVQQMLTPAPTVEAVNWKRAQLKAENWSYFDVKPEKLQRAIDDDIAWLAAHPTRAKKEA